MSTRLPLEFLSLGRTNVPHSPALSLPSSGGFEPPCDYDSKSTAEIMRQIMGEVFEKNVADSQGDDEPEVPQMSSLVNVKPPGVRLRPALSLRRTETLYSSSSSEDDDCESNTFSPIASLNSDETDASEYDLYERAMSFAKIRAANLGMGAAMKTLNATLEEEDPAAEERLSTVASKVIASISRSPPALERHFSYSSVLTDSSEGDDLTDVEREECDMVTDYIKRWAANNRLDSTYWQGFTPLHLSVAVPLVQELTVYLAEQAMRDVSAHLNLPPPLEYERSRPRLTSDPIHVGSARVAESGCLVRRAIPFGYDPQAVLDQILAAFNEECAATQRKPVQTVTLRLQSGAKRAAGSRKEATARRDFWTPTASKLRGDITLWMLANEEEAAVVVV